MDRFEHEQQGARHGYLPGERVQLCMRIIDDAPKPAAAATPKPTPTPTSSDSARAALKHPARSPSSTASTSTTKQSTHGKPVATAVAKPEPKPEPSPKASGKKPAAGLTDAHKAARTTVAKDDRPATDAPKQPTETSDSARAASKANVRTPSSTSSHEQQVEAQARQAERDKLNDAKNIDATVTPEQRTKLQAEQDEFLGIDRQDTDTPTKSGKLGTIAGAAGGATPNAPEQPPAPDDAPKQQPEPGGEFDDSPAQGIKIDPHVAAPGASPAGGTTQHTQEEWLEFLGGREYWVGDDGDVWHIDVLDDGTTTLSRNDDPDGQVNPPQIGPNRTTRARGGGLGGVVGGGATTPKGAGTPGQGKPKAGESSAEGVDGHDHASEYQVEVPATVDEAIKQQELQGMRIAQDTLPPADSRTASGMSIMMPDGSAVTSATTKEHWDVGVDRTSTTRNRVGDDDALSGFENYVVTEARHDDGSRVRSTNRASGGVYSHGLTQVDSAMGSGLSIPFDTQTTVTITAADGSRRSTDSKRPSPRETPTTTDELRRVQDELGLAYEAAASRQDRPDDIVDALFQDANSTMARIDANEIQRAAREGARNIAKDDPDAITDYADMTFEDVRARYAEFGLDAAAGNEDIDRDWLSDDPNVRSNAAYFSDDDEMKFGTLEDGTPFAASDDVIAHEFAHRITEHNGGVNYHGESGAINESLSDTLAAAVDTEDWIVGEDIVEGGVRDMSAKHTMDDFVETTDDHGGVHTNSAIPNYAAYLIGDDLGRDTMGRIYARTMNDYLSPDMKFTDLAVGTWRAAVDLYGETSKEAAAVREAWDGVLLLNGDTSIYDEQRGTVGSGGGGSGSGSW
ncbi:MAG: M4 family metallopeptidase [Thermoleophilia bacterium]|nr:M4 family metallopeptidase [Thermoleophilia bacterium]